MPNNGGPKTATDWMETCQRFIAEADRVLKTGERLIAYERFGYAVEAAAKSMIIRRGVLQEWPAPGEPHAEDVYTHSVLKLIKFGGIFQPFCAARQDDHQLAESWLIAKEWFPNRYSMTAPDHGSVVRLGRAAKVIIAWLDSQ